MSEDSAGNNAENWLVLRYSDPEFAVNVLSQDGIPCHSAEKTTIGEGVMFPASSAERVLDLLELPHEFSMEPTNRDHVFVIEISNTSTAVGPTSRWDIGYGDVGYGTPELLRRLGLSYDGPDFSKLKEREHFEQWDNLVPVLRGLYEIFGIRAEVDNPHGHRVTAYESTDDRVLFIHFWSAPGEGRGHHTKHKCVLGYDLVDGQLDFIHPSGIGHVFSDNDGTAFAEYIENNLYILFDLPHIEGRGGNVTDIFGKIVESYLKFKDQTEDELTAFKNIFLYGSRDGGESASRDMFIRSCSRLYERNLKEMELVLKKYDDTIDKYNTEIVKASRDRAILFDKYMPLKTSTIERQKWASGEYDALCATPHVERVVVKDKIIQVYTDMVTVPFEGRNYNIGKFRIDINTEGGGKDGVRAYNLTNRKRKSSDTYVHHPHVIGDGQACLGNISEGVTKLVADYQYVVLAQVMINFLHSYNPDSAYARIATWG